jgi:ABC-2 type transport system permease protein
MRQFAGYGQKGVMMIYDSTLKPPAAIEELVNIYRYRDLIIHLVRRDTTVRYKRSVLGIAWSMLNPLGMMIIITVVFQDLFNKEQFFNIYMLSGLLMWNFFSQTSLGVIRNLVWGGELFQRIYIPRSAFAIAAVGTSIVNLFYAIITLIVVKLVLGSPLSWTALYAPIGVIYLSAFSLGVGLIISSLAIQYNDVAEMYQILLTGWFYFTPIIYPLKIIPQKLLPWLKLNPMFHIVHLFRESFYSNQIPTISELLIPAAISFGVLIVGWLLFSKYTEMFVTKA